MRVNHLDRVTWPPVGAILRSCLAELLISSTWTINLPVRWRFWNLLTFSYCDFFTRNVFFLQESTLVFLQTIERAMKSVTVFRMSTCRSTLNSLFPAPTKSRIIFLKNKTIVYTDRSIFGYESLLVNILVGLHSSVFIDKLSFLFELKIRRSFYLGL